MEVSNQTSSTAVRETDIQFLNDSVSVGRQTAISRNRTRRLPPPRMHHVNVTVPTDNKLDNMTTYTRRNSVAVASDDRRENIITGALHNNVAANTRHNSVTFPSDERRDKIATDAGHNSVAIRTDNRCDSMAASGRTTDVTVNDIRCNSVKSGAGSDNIAGPIELRHDNELGDTRPVNIAVSTNSRNDSTSAYAEHNSSAAPTEKTTSLRARSKSRVTFQDVVSSSSSVAGSTNGAAPAIVTDRRKNDTAVELPSADRGNFHISITGANCTLCSICCVSNGAVELLFFDYINVCVNFYNHSLIQFQHTSLLVSVIYIV